MNQKMILVSGKIGSGKDTVADYLIKLNKQERWYGLKFWSKTPKMAKYSFADRLKYSGAIVSGNDVQDMYTQDGKNMQCENKSLKTYSNGKFLQFFGTDVCREKIDNNIWVNSVLLPKLNSFKLFGFSFIFYKKSNKDVIKIIPDTRFKNEAQFGKDNNAVLIRVEGDPLDVRKNSTRDLNHISETDLDDFDGWKYKINNNGTLNDLHIHLDHIYRHIKIIQNANKEK